MARRWPRRSEPTCVLLRARARAGARTRDAKEMLAAWLKERSCRPEDPLFPTARGGRLSSDAVERLVRKHAASAAEQCRSLRSKKVTPHVLRHSAAMELLGNGVDRAVIALWLGHESIETTHIYLHADMRMKEEALARTTPSEIGPKRYRPTKGLL